MSGSPGASEPTGATGGPGAADLLGAAPPALADALANGVVLLDGAVGTELQARGVDTAQALWSAQALLDAPGAVTAVHTSYLEAGAHVIETNSYQATVPALSALGYDRAGARELIAFSARLALAAVSGAKVSREGTAGGPGTFVAGALGPYGAFLADGSEYTGAYEPGEHGLEQVHRPRIEALAGQGLRLFALETMPRLDEVQRVVTILAQTVPDAECWVSFQVRPDGAHLADGTPLARAASWADSQEAVVSVGLNCVAPETVSRALPVLRGATGKPLVAYPNSGDRYDPSTRSWRRTWEGAQDIRGALDESDADTAGTLPATPGTGRLADMAEAWIEAGVRLVGGCCRTTPTDTAALASLVQAAA